MGCKSGSCGVAPFLFAGWSVWLSSFVSCAAGPRVVLSRFVLECKFTQNFLNMEIREGVSPSRMPMVMYFSEFFRVKKGERGLQERQGRGGCGGAAEPAAMQRLTQPETEPLLALFSRLSCLLALPFFSLLFPSLPFFSLLFASFPFFPLLFPSFTFFFLLFPSFTYFFLLLPSFPFYLTFTFYFLLTSRCLFRGIRRGWCGCGRRRVLRRLSPCRGRP